MPTSTADIRGALAEVWAATGRDAGALGAMEITGADPVLPGPYRIGTAAAAAVASSVLAAAELWRERGGTPGAVAIDARHATAAFGSERHLLVDDRPAADLWAELSGNYRSADGWVRLHCNYPHHAAAAFTALGASAQRGSVAAAVAALSASEVERRVYAAGGCAAALRTREAWSAHPQNAAIRALRLLSLSSVGAGDSAPLPPGDRPLAGIRVLDLTRVISGPVAGRTLAAHGAQVLRIGADHLPLVRPLVIDTGFGKRFAHIDLRTPDGRARLRALVRDAHVVLQAYRPGALAARGFGPADCARIRPGLVYVSISAYGHNGPWRNRRGFDSLVQMATGLAAPEGSREAPRQLPVQALDHATGYLAALGAIEGLRRRASGSWHVQVSFDRTARWLDQLGRIEGAAGSDTFPIYARLSTALSAASPTYVPQATSKGPLSGGTPHHTSPAAIPPCGNHEGLPDPSLVAEISAQVSAEAAAPGRRTA